MSNVNLVIVDTETTGVDVNTDSIIQLGAVLARVSQEEVQTQIIYNAYCKPTCEIAAGASEVHGIYDKDLVWHPPVSWALYTLGLMLKELSLSSEVILCGHNLERYDIPLMHRQAPNAGFHDYKTIDTYNAGLRMFPLMPLKLSEFFEWYIEETAINAHDAVADCMMCAKLLHKIMVEKDMDEHELSDYLAEAHPFEVMPWGKYKGLPVEEVPISYWQWAQRNWDNTPKDMDATMCKILECD
jgi:DNA polymerase-3 subunit epsilon